MLQNLTVVIPFRDGHETIHKLLLSLPRMLPVLIIDDCSDRTLTIEDNSDIKVVRLTKRSYFAGAVNAGIQFCMTDVLVLNQDVWFEDTRWYQVIEQNREQYAMFGERIKGQHPTFGAKGYIHGTFMFLRRDAIDSVGLLNSKDYPLWGGTAEWQLRAARKGFSVLPLVEIPGFHHDRPRGEPFGSSIKTLLTQEPEKAEILVRTPPLLSVIVPCYNYGRYIKDCINSLIGGPTCLGEMPGQTLQSFEVIIVDDASTDDSLDAIIEVAKPEQGIRAYHLSENVGTAQALNFGIQKAVGKYITFLSADDMREADSLTNLVRCCEENPHSFAYDDMWIFYKHKRIKQWQMEEYDFDTLIHKNQVHAGIVFPKKAWEEVGGYSAIMYDGREDWAFNIALGIHGWCGVHVKQFGYLYRREGQNRTETNTSAYHMDYFRDKVKSLFPKIYGGYRPMACCGKGSNTKANNVVAKSNRTLATNENGARMANNSVGAAGMVRLQYAGQKMSATWDGPATGQSYTFGVDKPRGWVDKRDVGERNKSGFLNMKDRNNQWLFSVATDNAAAISVPVSENGIENTPLAVVEAQPNVQVVLAGGEADITTSHATASLSVAEKPKVDVPDPTDMNAEEVKRLNLTKEQWTEVYRIELANRHRKGVVAFLEEKLADLG